MCQGLAGMQQQQQLEQRQQQQQQARHKLFTSSCRPQLCTTAQVNLALECLEDPAAQGVTTQEGTMEAAVFLCDISSLPGAERAFIEAAALPRLKATLWLLAPYHGLSITIAECLLCTLHRLCDAFSHYRKVMVRQGFVALLVHTLECTTRPDSPVHSAFIRRASSTILARLANKSDLRRQAVLDGGAVRPLLRTFTMGIPELVAAQHVARQLPLKKAQQQLRGPIRLIAEAEPRAGRYLQGYYCGPEHERLASAAAAAALAAISQGSAEAGRVIAEERESSSLLMYPLAVGCANIMAVKQETEAVLQVLLNLANSPAGSQAVRDAGIIMVLQSLIHSVSQQGAGRRSPRSQREMLKKVAACAMELLQTLGSSYVLTTLCREPLFSISEDREVVCKEDMRAGPRIVKHAQRAMDTFTNYIRGRVGVQSDNSFIVDW